MADSSDDDGADGGAAAAPRLSLAEQQKVLLARRSQIMKDLAFGVPSDGAPPPPLPASKKRPRAAVGAAGPRAEPAGASRYPRRGVPGTGGGSGAESAANGNERLADGAMQRRRPRGSDPARSAAAAQRAAAAVGAAADVRRTYASGRPLEAAASAPTATPPTAAAAAAPSGASPGGAVALPRASLIKATVKTACSIKAFVEGALGVERYVAGRGFHELQSGTSVHTTEGWVVEHVASGAVYRGREAVAAVGARAFVRTRKGEPPADLPPGFRLFLRSKSYSRVLREGQRFIYEHETDDGGAGA